MNSRNLRLLSGLEEDLGERINGLFADALCEDIVLNHDGTLWAKRFGSGWQQEGTLHAHDAVGVIKSVATLRGIEANEDHPIIETILPSNGCRFQGVLPPLVQSPIFAIRIRARQIYTIDDYVAQGALSNDQGELLKATISDRKTILVSGSTGSGKTTLLNAFIHHLATLRENPRVLLIEDTPELQCTLANHTALLASAKTSMLACLSTAMRLIPSRIIVGEVRGAEALSMLKAFNTGHRGGLSTIHANHARAALLRLETLVQEAVPHFDAQPLIAEAIDVIVHIDGPTETHPRRVSEIVTVAGYQDGYQLVSF